MDITVGTKVLAKDAYGDEHEMTADSGIERAGHSFPVVWVLSPLRAGGTDRIPWPADALRAP